MVSPRGFLRLEETGVLGGEQGQRSEGMSGEQSHDLVTLSVFSHLSPLFPKAHEPVLFSS